MLAPRFFVLSCEVRCLILRAQAVTCNYNSNLCLLDQDEIREFAAAQFLPEGYQVTSLTEGIVEYCSSYRKDFAVS